MRLGWHRCAVLFAAAIGGACVGGSQFACTEDAQCNDGALEGWCEETGFCSFPDGACESGRRYGTLSGALSSTCVPVDGATGSTTSGEATETTSTTQPTQTESDDTSGGPQPSSIVADPALPRQTMDAFGVHAWDFPFVGGDGWNWRAAQGAFEEVDIGHVRLITLFFAWEPDNDNDDPLTPEWTAFDPTSSIEAEAVAFAGWLADRGYSVSVEKVTFPDWLTPDGGSIPESMAAEFAESAATLSFNLEQAEGVAVDWIDVWNIDYAGSSPFSDQAAHLTAARDLLVVGEKLGLQAPLIGPNAPVSRPDWISTWFADATLADATPAIAVRGSGSYLAEDYVAVGQAALDLGLPVWATDNWYCTEDHGCDEVPAFDATTWHTAWAQAQSNYRLIADARASRVYHGALLGVLSSIDPATGAARPPFHVLKHFANYVPAGSILLTTVVDDPDVLALVFDLPGDGFSAVVLNVGEAPSTLRLAVDDTPPRPAADAVQSAEDAYFQAVTFAAGPDGWPELTLPPQSLTSLRL